MKPEDDTLVFDFNLPGFRTPSACDLFCDEELTLSNTETKASYFPTVSVSSVRSQFDKTLCCKQKTFDIELKHDRSFAKLTTPTATVSLLQLNEEKALEIVNMYRDLQIKCDMEDDTVYLALNLFYNSLDGTNKFDQVILAAATCFSVAAKYTSGDLIYISDIILYVHKRFKVLFSMEDMSRKEVDIVIHHLRHVTLPSYFLYQFLHHVYGHDMMVQNEQEINEMYVHLGKKIIMDLICHPKFIMNWFMYGSSFIAMIACYIMLPKTEIKKLFVKLNYTIQFQQKFHCFDDNVSMTDLSYIDSCVNEFTKIITTTACTDPMLYSVAVTST